MRTSSPTRTQPAAPAEPREHRQRGAARWLLRIGIVVGVVVALGYVAIGWYVSGEIIAGLRVDPPAPIEYDTDVVELSADRITLRRPDEDDLEVDRDAVVGLSWRGGYGQAGPTLAGDGGTETRAFTLLAGDPPPIGTEVIDVDSFAFPPDPAQLGLGYETVTFPSPLGELEAWSFPGRGDTWLITVHGVGADRHEFLRLHAAIGELGYPTLMIRYRNDPGMPATDGSLILAGQDELEDVAAAVAYARAQGAADVVLAGASMGGSLVLGYLVEGDVEVVRGAILEAPNADLREVVRLRSGEALPVGGPIGASFLAAGRAVTSLRTGIDFDAVDYVARADELATPILLFHGADDRTIPIDIGENLAAARPDLVEFHPIPDAGHVRAWNEDPDTYAGTVTDFLERIGRAG